jgi:hypothetical protein
MSEHLGVTSVRLVRGCICVAEQCRRLGLQVGDTIEGTESGPGWWNTTRLTLLWLGETEAAWRMTDKSVNRPEWSEPEEAVNWTLDCREWRKV